MYLSITFLFRILDILDSRRVTFQLQYQLIFCLWMLSYRSDVVERMKEYVIYVHVHCQLCIHVVVYMYMNLLVDE